MTDVARELALHPCVLALDVGTSSFRAQVMDARGRAVRGLSVQIKYSMRTTADGGVETSPEEIERHVIDAVDAVLASAGAFATSIRVVAMSTIWHSMIGVDKQGHAITPLYTWADTRSAQAADELKGEMDEREMHKRTGCFFHTSYFPAKLRWIRESQPDVWKRAWRWLSFGEYLYLQLFGDAVCSISMASGTGLLNQHTKTWDRPVLDLLHLAPEQLSPLGDLDQPAHGLRDTYAARWPALAEIPWLPAIGDGAASNIGAGCVTPSRIALMVGTSGAMRVIWPGDDVVVPPGIWCYRADGRRFVLGGALSNGGILISWLTDSFRIASLSAAETELASATPDGHGLTLLPFLAGERSPGWASHARAAVVGLSLHSRPLDVLQAGLESVAYRFALIYELLRPVASDACEIIASGGALLNLPVWVQIMADVLGQPVVASSEPEASTRGAAVLALEAIGAIAQLDDAPATFGEKYLPRMDRHVIYQAARERQRALYHLLVEQRWDISTRPNEHPASPPSRLSTSV